MSVDLLAVNSDNLIFPLWMTWVEKHQERFETILIGLHKKNIPSWDFTPEIKTWAKTIKNIKIVEPEEDITVDWRNRAINACLDQSTAKRVLFMEQDFFIKEKTFDEAMNTDSELVGVTQDGKRIHPCFLLVNRSVVNQTSRDFSAHSPQYDHFGKFTNEAVASPTKWGFILDGWFHMNGLTQNYTLVQLGEKPNHDIASFMLYNMTSLDPKYPRYNELCHLAEQSLTGLGEFI